MGILKKYIRVLILVPGIALAGLSYYLNSLPPKPGVVDFEEGIKAYRDGDFDRAQSFFEKVVGEAEDERLKERAYYNFANTLVAMVESGLISSPMHEEELLNDAVRAYENALRIDSTDWEAKHNLERLYILHKENGGKGNERGDKKLKIDGTGEEDPLENFSKEEKEREMREKQNQAKCGAYGSCYGQNFAPEGI